MHDDGATRLELSANELVLVQTALKLLFSTLGREEAEELEEVRALLARLERNLRLAKERVSDLQGRAVERSKAAARATDHYVHEHPWQAIGVALGLGVVIGLLLNRR